MASENPHTHISRFLDMCQHFRYQGISDDAIRLRLFPHTLRDKALEWLDSLPVGSITTWNEELFERMATTSAMWSTDQVVQKRVPGVYEVDTYSALSTKIDSLFYKVESISQTATTKQVMKQSCEKCGADHSTATCPILAQGVEHAEFAQWGQRQQNNPHSETFNPGWRKQPNFSWANQN
ncbi:uncharacterized protein LOC111385964 [Olea europaea var. sylvestris]|uniref:uncharacterized protein LOC111385964 n=1 Tax=Olea europaea var. sylvestris TaxID=158386 RepID=UPI000C1D02C2|nr:uncharacterized protein LOC111385964 [Olea europaea var. sylvestris]